MKLFIFLMMFFLLIFLQSCESKYAIICSAYNLQVRNCEKMTKMYLKSIQDNNVKYNICTSKDYINLSQNYMQLSKEEEIKLFHQNFDSTKIDFIIITYIKGAKVYYLLSSFDKYCQNYNKDMCIGLDLHFEPQYGISYLKNSCNMEGLNLQEIISEDESYDLKVYFKNNQIVKDSR